MVKVAVTAQNQFDNGSRIWGLSSGNIPAGNWTKDSSIKTAVKRSGELFAFDWQLADGKHAIYFIVSQTMRSNGTYSGDATFDGVSFPFSGVDNDSIAVFYINVKNGKASRAGANVPTVDIPGNTMTTGAKGQRPWHTVMDKIRGIKNMTKEQQIRTGTIIGAVLVSGIVGYLVWKRVSKPKRRL